MPESSASSRSAAAEQARPSVANRHWIAAAVGATIFIAAVEGSIVATAMPAIVGELGGFDLFSWVFTSYMLTQAITVPTYGRLADIFGRKRVLFLGIALFLIGSVLCGLAWDMISLIAFRVVQGIGAGCLVPVALTIVGDIYEPAERARMQGYFSGVWAAAAVIGPGAGAFLIAHGTWPLIFWVNVPVGLIAVVMLAITMRETVAHRQHAIDYGGSVLVMLGTGLMMFGFVQAPSLSGPTIAVLIGGGALALVALVFYEQRVPEPMIPLALWRLPVVAGASLAGTAIGILLIGASVFLSIYVQVVMGETPIVAGWVLTCVSFSWFFGSVAGGRLMLRTSYRATVATGGVTLALGSVVMILMHPDSGPTWAGVGGFIIGVGLGFTNNTFTVASQASVEFKQRGAATSSIAFTRMLGQALGAAVYGGVLNLGLSGKVADAADIVNHLMDPALRHRMPAEQLATVSDAISGALHNVFIIQGVMALVVLATALALPKGLNPHHKS